MILKEKFLALKISRSSINIISFMGSKEIGRHATKHYIRTKYFIGSIFLSHSELLMQCLNVVWTTDCEAGQKYCPKRAEFLKQVSMNWFRAWGKGSPS